MASYIKESSTVNITVVDSDYQETIFKIDEPREDVTLQECKNAFANVLAQQLLFTRDGLPFTEVSRASLVVTRIVTSDLE